MKTRLGHTFERGDSEFTTIHERNVMKKMLLIGLMIIGSFACASSPRKVAQITGNVGTAKTGTDALPIAECLFQAPEVVAAGETSGEVQIVLSESNGVYKSVSKYINDNYQVMINIGLNPILSPAGNSVFTSNILLRDLKLGVATISQDRIEITPSLKTAGMKAVLSYDSKKINISGKDIDLDQVRVVCSLSKK